MKFAGSICTAQAPWVLWCLKNPWR